MGLFAFQEPFIGIIASLAPAHCLRPDAGAVAWLAQHKLAAGETADLATSEPEYGHNPAYRKIQREPVSA